MNASSATAARRCISMRDVAAVTLRVAGARRGSMSWRRHTARWKPLPAALRARVADALIAAAPAVTESASGMGDRSGAPASGSSGRTGTSVRDLCVAPTSLASNATAPSLPLPSAATNRAWRCSIADCGWSVTRASLSASVPTRATTFAETRHSESPTESSPRQTSGSSSSAGSPMSRFGSGSVDSRAWRMRYASAGPTVATYSSRPRTTATATPIGPAPSAWCPRPYRSRWCASRLLATPMTLIRHWRMPADSS